MEVTYGEICLKIIERILEDYPDLWLKTYEDTVYIPMSDMVPGSRYHFIILSEWSVKHNIPVFALCFTDNDVHMTSYHGCKHHHKGGMLYIEPIKLCDPYFFLKIKLSINKILSHTKRNHEDLMPSL